MMIFIDMSTLQCSLHGEQSDVVHTSHITLLQLSKQIISMCLTEEVVDTDSGLQLSTVV